MVGNAEALLAEFERLKKVCQQMDGMKISVGIIGGGDAAKIAHIHEYGDGKMPERSFIRASFDADQGQLTSIVSEQVKRVLDGGTSAQAAANAIGAQAAQLVQGYIDANRVMPPSDFSKKTQHTTLYETGTHIRDRIAYKVEG